MRRGHRTTPAWVPAAAGMLALTTGAFAVGVAGVAGAASGGGYDPHQQDCQAFADDWATPQGLVYPGCHNLAVNVESGGTAEGDTSPTSTRYLELGMDQMGNDANSKGTPTLYSIGLPGNTGSPHAGCLAMNTDGTGGGAAPATLKPETASAAEDSPYGCGSNPEGTGFELNFDYYQWYCPIVAAAGHPCEDPSYGKTTGTIDHGVALASAPLSSSGLAVYFGEDDNVDNTEHDGVGPYTDAYNKNDEGAENGPSDGGATMLSLDPKGATRIPSLTQPEGIVNSSAGFCADGICLEGTSQQQAVAHGCNAPDSYVAADGTSPSATSQAPCAPGTPHTANVFDYATQDPSVSTESAACNSGGPRPSSQAVCGPGGEDAIRSSEPATEYAEPGVQLYADPDSSRSPALPSPLWPTPGLYVGTCGVYAGSPALPTAALINRPPVGNGAGQVKISTGSC